MKAEQERRNIELLSPARNADVGMEAISHGADAVYIGGPAFGARQAAANSVADIERLCHFAHTYYAKVYVTLNTIIADEELEAVRQAAWQLYEAGADALIVQDLGLLKLDLPPMALHASTQCDTRTPQKARLLQDLGFDQIVLARELSLDKIRAIAEQTSVRLEVFVHGALCVCYSGQCYLSQALMSRSANRGECAQLCRMPYDLVDAQGRKIDTERLRPGRHLLSLRDMDRSALIAELINAGASSFKIEGRLKDASYVKNITAVYRRAIDEVLEKDGGLNNATGGGPAYTRTSSGKSVYTFLPQKEKSFNRGFCNYFLRGRDDVASWLSPKSQGECVGRVLALGPGRRWIDVTISAGVATTGGLHNGDGFCLCNKDGEPCGFLANTVAPVANKDRHNGGAVVRISADNLPDAAAGATLNRNKDVVFEGRLNKQTSTRTIGLEVEAQITSQAVCLMSEDEDGVKSSLTLPCQLTQAHKPAEENSAYLREQLGRLGGTAFCATGVRVQNPDNMFVPGSLLSTWRRALVDEALAQREAHRQRPQRQPMVTPLPQTPFLPTNYRANAFNHLAVELLTELGARPTEPAFEAWGSGNGNVAVDAAATTATTNGSANDDVVLMTCRYCLRHALGACLKTQGGKNLPSALRLRCSNGRLLTLTFDCKACEMLVTCKKSELPNLGSQPNRERNNAK